MKTISLVNEKGGVGKTTLAVHLAAGLAMRGHKVLISDCDPQANATRQLRVEEAPALHDLIVRHAPWKNLLKVAPREAWLPENHSTSGALYVLAGNVETRAISTLTDDVMAFRERIAELENAIDFVILDTAPTPSLFHSMVYLATDIFIYPTLAEALSLEGIAKTEEHVTKLNKARATFGVGNARTLAIQPTMFAQTNSHEYGLTLLNNKFGELVYPPMPKRTIWQNASWERQTVFAYAPDEKASGDAWAFVDRVVSSMELENAR